jgi:hypothetical protein
MTSRGSLPRPATTSSPSSNGGAEIERAAAALERDRAAVFEAREG